MTHGLPESSDGSGAEMEEEWGVKWNSVTLTPRFDYRFRLLEAKQTSGSSWESCLH